MADASDPDQRQTLHIAYVEFAPFIYTDENGNAAGTSKALSEQIASRAGYRLQWLALPINRVVMYLERGQVDLWLGIAGQPHLQAIVIETQADLATVSLSAYHRNRQPRVDSLEDLQDKKLILISGYTYQGKLDGFLTDPTSQYARAPNHEAGLKMLIMDRGDYLLNYDEPLSQIFHNLPITPVERSPISRERGTFLVSRQAREARTIAQRLDQAFGEMQAEVNQ